MGLSQAQNISFKPLLNDKISIRAIAVDDNKYFMPARAQNSVTSHLKILPIKNSCFYQIKICSSGHWHRTEISFTPST